MKQMSRDAQVWKNSYHESSFPEAKAVFGFVFTDVCHEECELSHYNLERKILLSMRRSQGAWVWRGIGDRNVCLSEQCTCEESWVAMEEAWAEMICSSCLWSLGENEKQFFFIA